jgi:hypothetical protein
MHEKTLSNTHSVPNKLPNLPTQTYPLYTYVLREFKPNKKTELLLTTTTKEE